MTSVLTNEFPSKRFAVDSDFSHCVLEAFVSVRSKRLRHHGGANAVMSMHVVCRVPETQKRHRHGKGALTGTIADTGDVAHSFLGASAMDSKTCPPAMVAHVVFSRNCHVACPCRCVFQKHKSVTGMEKAPSREQSRTLATLRFRFWGHPRWIEKSARPPCLGVACGHVHELPRKVPAMVHGRRQSKFPIRFPISNPISNFQLNYFQFPIRRLGKWFLLALAHVTHAMLFLHAHADMSGNLPPGRHAGHWVAENRGQGYRVCKKVPDFIW
jgi:hypothetical protein